jgi:hypothetical protein
MTTSVSTITDNILTIQTESPVILFYQSFSTSDIELSSTITVTQNYLDPLKLKDNNNNDRYINEFEILHIYICRVTIVNSASDPLLLDILIQLPEGSIPILYKDNYFRNKNIVKSIYQFYTIDYQFYFPEVGKFQHYPVHVSKQGKVNKI